MTPGVPLKSLVLFCSVLLSLPVRGHPLTHVSAGVIPASRLFGRNPLTVKLLLNEEQGETLVLRS
jgi:hypothetical protein